MILAKLSFTQKIATWDGVLLINWNKWNIWIIFHALLVVFKKDYGYNRFCAYKTEILVRTKSSEISFGNSEILQNC